MRLVFVKRITEVQFGSFARAKRWTRLKGDRSFRTRQKGKVRFGEDIFLQSQFVDVSGPGSESSERALRDSFEMRDFSEALAAVDYARGPRTVERDLAKLGCVVPKACHDGVVAVVKQGLHDGRGRIGHLALHLASASRWPVFESEIAKIETRSDVGPNLKFAAKIERDYEEYARAKKKGTPKPTAEGLMSAVYDEDLARVEALLAAGAPANAVSALAPVLTRPMSALELAIARKNLEIVRALSSGGSGDVIDVESGATALHKAAYVGSEEIVEYLLAHGADPNARAASGETPLRVVAREMGRAATRIAKRLLAAGAKATLEDRRAASSKSMYALIDKAISPVAPLQRFVLKEIPSKIDRMEGGKIFVQWPPDKDAVCVHVPPSDDHEAKVELGFLFLMNVADVRDALAAVAGKSVSVPKKAELLMTYAETGMCPPWVAKL